MRPPICAICNDRFSIKKGISGLVHYKKTQDQIDQEEERQKQNSFWVGHPKNQEWFCEKHYEKAKKLSDLTRNEAIKILRHQKSTEDHE